MKTRYVFKAGKGLKIFFGISVIIILAAGATVVDSFITQSNIEKAIAARDKAEELEMDEVGLLKISEACVEDNIGKTIKVVGFMGGTMADDGTMAWILEKPFVAYSNFINSGENLICIEPKAGRKFEYSEMAVVVTGVLKANLETAEWFMTDSVIEEYDNDDEINRLTEFNMLIDNGYADIVEALAAVIFNKLNFDELAGDTDEDDDTEDIKEATYYAELDNLMELLKNYVDLDYVGSAYKILEELNGLIDEMDSYRSTKELRADADRLNGEAQEIYVAYYSLITEAGKDLVY